MSIDISGSGPIKLPADVGLDDAEPLLSALLARPGRGVDLSSVTFAHTAVIQVLIALKPPIDGNAASSFLRQWIEPLMIARGIGGVGS